MPPLARQRLGDVSEAHSRVSDGHRGAAGCTPCLTRVGTAGQSCPGESWVALPTLLETSGAQQSPSVAFVSRKKCR